VETFTSVLEIASLTCRRLTVMLQCVAQCHRWGRTGPLGEAEWCSAACGF
jgi:hypothetical protein